jgi:hypothetical protein
MVCLVQGTTLLDLLKFTLFARTGIRIMRWRWNNALEMKRMSSISSCRVGNSVLLVMFNIPSDVFACHPGLLNHGSGMSDTGVLIVRTHARVTAVIGDVVWGRKVKGWWVRVVSHVR